MKTKTATSRPFSWPVAVSAPLFKAPPIESADVGKALLVLVSRTDFGTRAGAPNAEDVATFCSNVAVFLETDLNALRGAGASGVIEPVCSPAAVGPLAPGSISTYWPTAEELGFGGLFEASADALNATSARATASSIALWNRHARNLCSGMNHQPRK